jgi:acetyl esterase/lipase
MTLHPGWRYIRDQRATAAAVPLYEQTLAEARAADLASIRAGSGPVEHVEQVVDRTFAGPDDERPVRVYRPASTGPLPVVVYFFGGGWTLGSIDTADAVARRLAIAVPAVVVVPGYRLAPEHPFPAAVEDCYAAVRWAAAHAAQLGGRADRIAVAGDSAGGNLAAVTALLARDRSGPILAGQALVYPNTDYTAADASLRENIDRWLFNTTSVGWYWGHYLRDPTDGTNPLASPALAGDHCGLPPALILTAGHDPLRDQGERYAATLRAAGVRTELRRYDTMAHGFFTMSGVLDAAAQAQRQVADALRDWFGVPAPPVRRDNTVEHGP